MSINRTRWNQVIVETLQFALPNITCKGGDHTCCCACLFELVIFDIVKEVKVIYKLSWFDWRLENLKRISFKIRKIIFSNVQNITDAIYHSFNSTKSSYEDSYNDDPKLKTKHTVQLLEVQLPYNQICSSVCQTACRLSVCHSLLKG